MDYLTDKDYNEIAQKAYKLDPKENSSKEQLYKGSLIEVGNRQFQVIDAIGNSAEPTENSMQAMAVAPVDDQGNVDYNQVVVSYVGTNFGEKKIF
jgi:possible lipase